VTRHLLNDLALPKEEVRDLLDRYNERLKEAGEETWSERELDHKVSSASDRPGGAEPADDPHRRARTFREGRPWVFWNGLHFEYTGTRYVEVPDYEVATILASHVKESLDTQYRERYRYDYNPRRPVFKHIAI
jgi:hypothetical protein